MDKDKDAEQAVTFDHDQQQMFRKENEAPLATRTAEAEEAAEEDDITIPGVERPGNEEVKEEINPNTE